MRITSVSYRELQTLPGRYENRTVEATAEVGPGEDSTLVLEKLQEWVKAQLGQAQTEREAQQRLQQARWELQAVERQLTEGRAAVEKVRAFLLRVGVDPDKALEPDDLPF